MDKKFILSYYDITKKLMKSVLNQNKYKNAIISPYSYILLMSILLEGTDGKTLDEIIESFGFSKSKILELQEDLNKIHECLKHDRELKIANAVFTSLFKYNDFNKEFLSKLKDKNGEVFVSKNIEKDINEWVSKKTKGLIKNLNIPIKSNTILGILNAIAFDSEWETKYKKNDINEDLEFNNIDKTKSKAVFLRSEEDTYLEDKNFTGFVKEYKDGKYLFAALLPKAEGETALQKAIDKSDLYKVIFNDKSNYIVNALLPEFESKYVFNLNNFCNSIGIKQTFNNDADFSKMIYAPIHVSSIDQETYIKVDREGTKAVAITMAQFVFTGAMHIKKNIKIICLDRPFVYMVIHSETKIPIFVGIVNKLGAY